MKLRDILKVAGTVAGTVNPALGTVIGAVNAVLPPRKRMPESATGDEVAAVVDALPPDQIKQIELQVQRELGLEEQYTEQWRILNDADASGSSTRPEIARQMAHTLVFEILAFTVFVFYLLAQGGTDALTGLSTLWTVFGTLTGVPAAVILRYFNVRTQEKRTRYAVAHNQPADLTGAIGSIIKSLRGG